MRVPASLFVLALAGCSKGPDIDCSTYTLEIPSVRGELTGTWDDARVRLVFFGGNDDVPVECAFGATNFRADTWEYNRTCGAFREIVTPEAPSPRGRHSTATDGQRMYIAHGRFREGTSGDYASRRDVWSFDYATEVWTRLSAGTGPSARSNSAMVHLDGKLWVFGGNTSAFGGAFNPLDDLWSFDLTTYTWTEHTPTNQGPEARLFHGMATDGELIYVYGGGDENAFLGPFLDDLWAYDPQSNTWTEMRHSGDPGEDVPLDRFWANIEYDPVDDALILFGGHDNTALGNTNQVYRYALAEGRWYRDREGDTFNAPPAGFCDFPADFVNVDRGSPERRNAGASAMTGDGQLVIFGGKTDCGLINDVWSYNPGALEWTVLSPPTSGEACERASAACDTLCF